jgi:DNA polymerase-3 subunit alpha
MTKPFASIHNHTQHSPMDSIASSEDYARRAKERGYVAVSITDHGKLSGHRQHQKAFAGSDIKPILGIETYFSVTDRFDKRAKAKRSDGTSVYNHLIVLAQNENGLRNVNRINEIAWNEGFYSKARIDKEVIERYSEDIIVTSACMSGPIAQALLNGEEDRAYARAEWFKQVLGDRFYIEVMTENSADLNQQLLLLADTLGIAPVLTEDTHYVWPEDLWIEEGFLISSTNPKQIKGTTYANMPKGKATMIDKYNYLYGPPNDKDADGNQINKRMQFQEFNLYMAGRDFREAEMLKQGIDRSDIFDNTVVIADRIGEYPLHKNLNLLPKPKANDPEKRLRDICRTGMRERGFAGMKEYEDRLEYELSVIEKKGFSSYFIIVSNMMKWMKKNKIMTGFGRGSNAGSLVCYVTRITEVDPIRFKLKFERFLDESRPDWPDSDQDVSDRRRGDVKKYLEREYKYVASIATMNTFKVKNSLQTAASILGVSFSETQRATKYMPELNAQWEDYLEGPYSKEFHKKYPEVYELAKAFEGRIKNAGMHPAGIVITNQPASNYFPIESAEDKSTGERIPLIAYDMAEVEEMGGIKIDLLGLKTLSVVEDCLNMIERRHGKLIDITEIPLDDDDVFKMLDECKTKGIFQAEGHTFTKWIRETGVKSFNDLVVGTSIARPGPMNTVGKIYKRRLAKEEIVEYVHPVMEEHLEETLGCIVYQEQVMSAVVDLAGMTVAESNQVRRVLSKKKDKALLEKYRAEFVDGASKKIDRDKAVELWHDIEAHTGYSFNKSHAVAYSMLTNATAWLKYHYPVEFMYALINNQDKPGKVITYMIEAKKMGVSFLMPHVNKSEAEMTIEGDAIRLGLSNIRNISTAGSAKIIAARPFNNYGELLDLSQTKYSGINKRIIDSLNAVGAASFDDNPRTGRESDNYFHYLNIPTSLTGNLPDKIVSQITAAEDYEEDVPAIVMGIVMDIKKKGGFSLVEMLDDTGTLSFFANEEAPLQKGEMYLCLLANKRPVRYLPANEVKPNNPHELIRWLRFETPVCAENEAYIIAFTGRTTLKGARMGTLTYGLPDKEIRSCTVWPSDYHTALGRCKPGTIVKLDTTLNDKGDRFFAGVR